MIHTYEEFLNENKSTLKHYLFDENDQMVHEYEVFNAEQIKADIIAYLEKNPQGMLTHEKDYTPSLQKKYYGKDVLNTYENNPKTGQPSKVVTKGSKDYYKPLK